MQYFNSPFVLMVLKVEKHFSKTTSENFSDEQTAMSVSSVYMEGRIPFLEHWGPSCNRKAVLQPLWVWLPSQNTNCSFTIRAKKKSGNCINRLIPFLAYFQINISNGHVWIVESNIYNWIQASRQSGNLSSDSIWRSFSFLCLSALF